MLIIQKKNCYLKSLKKSFSKEVLHNNFFFHKKATKTQVIFSDVGFNEIPEEIIVIFHLKYFVKWLRGAGKRWNFKWIKKLDLTGLTRRIWLDKKDEFLLKWISKCNTRKCFWRVGGKQNF